MSQPQALIFGYGFTAQSMDRFLTEAGYETIGVRRDWTDEDTQNLNSQPLEADITRAETFEVLPRDPDVIVNSVSSGSRGDPERYRRVYLNGSRNLLDWADNQSTDVLIWTGSASVYGDRDGRWVDETTALKPDTEAAEILAETEQLYRDAVDKRNIPTVVLRLTGIYGRGRSRAIQKLKSKNGALSLSLNEANYFMNMVHRVDIGKAVAAIASAPKPGETFNVVDNEPTTRRKLYVWLSQKLDKPLPKLTGGGRPSFHNKRVSNDKLLENYDFELEYPTFREGYTAILEKSF